MEDYYFGNYFDLIDDIIKKMVFSKSSLERFYLAYQQDIIEDIYEEGFQHEKELIEPYEEELKNHPIVKRFVKQLDGDDKLELYKRTSNATRLEVFDLNWDDVRDLLFEDKWCCMTKHYIYLRAYKLFEEDEDDGLISKVYNMLKKIDYHKRILPKSKTIAINKIRRNSIYNFGLGLKIAKKQYVKDFA